SKKVGEVFPGVVTGVNARGLFVQIDKFVVDGFIKTTDLIVGAATGKPPRWMLEKKTGALVDANSGRSYNVGHMVNVSILHVDLLKRQLELAIADGSSRNAGKSKGSLLTLGTDGGGLGGAQGAGFKQRTGGERRAAKSKRRDKGKADHRADRK